MPQKSYKWYPSPYANYTVSVTGEVRCGKNPIVRKYWPNGKPFVFIKTAFGPVSVDVEELVAWTFLGAPPRDGSYMVAHKNGDTSDCRAENLAWVVNPELHFDAIRRLMAVPAWYTPGLKHRRS